MGVGDVLGVHVELEVQVVFSVVIVLAACVAGWRYIRAASRRRVGTQCSERREDDAPQGRGAA